jgi:hypothetical protein
MATRHFAPCSPLSRSVGYQIFVQVFAEFFPHSIVIAKASLLKPFQRFPIGDDSI